MGEHVLPPLLQLLRSQTRANLVTELCIEVVQLWLRQSGENPSSRLEAQVVFILRSLPIIHVMRVCGGGRRHSILQKR